MPEADKVTTAYDRIAASWRNDRLTGSTGFRERQFLERLTSELPPAAKILDVGCGCGEPIAAFLAGQGFRVIGLDGSARMLEFARGAVPTATFIHGDMRTAAPNGPFDAIVAWDSVFHVPRSEHGAVFARFRSWLRLGGRLLVSLGGTAGDVVTSQMHGETFSYSGYEPAEALRVLERAGFKVDHWEVDDPSSLGHIAVVATACVA